MAQQGKQVRIVFLFIGICQLEQGGNYDYSKIAMIKTRISIATVWYMPPDFNRKKIKD
jgi:hypothetical protein